MSGTAIPGNLFCAHKKLTTTCPDCRPPPAENPVARARAEKEKRDAAKKQAAKAARGAGDTDEAGEKKATRPTRARRKRVKPPTREEAEQAEAWWVK